VEPSSGLVLFDGECNLCDASVRFIYRHDPAGYFRFASLQSAAAARALAAIGATAPPNVETVLLLDGDGLHERSDAALRIAARLRAPWSWLAGLRVLPRGLRDAAYDVVARNRHRWFGKRDLCSLPSDAMRSRFL